MSVIHGVSGIVKVPLGDGNASYGKDELKQTNWMKNGIKLKNNNNDDTHVYVSLSNRNNLTFDSTIIKQQIIWESELWIDRIT